MKTLPSLGALRAPFATRTTRVTLALLGALLGASPAQAQRFDVQPASGEVLPGAPVQIRLAGLPPRAALTLAATRAVRDFSGRRLYAAQADFTAGADGTLDLATAEPLPGGSYGGADLRGLMWSMVPQREAPADLASYGDGEVRLAARIGGQIVATQTLQLRSAAPALQWREATPFPGAKLAWLPGGTAKKPAIIALGGSEGGSFILRQAGLLASHGYAVLGLPYYSPAAWGAAGPQPPELPALPAAFADIPVDRLQQARDWLAQQPEVDASRIALYGVSKGAEFVLIASTKFDWVRSVVAIVPSDVVWEGWGPGVVGGQRSSFSWQGKPLPFVPYVDFEQEFLGFQTGQPVRIRRPHDRGRAAHPQRIDAARIPVEQFAGPLLVVGGHDDQVWDSGGMAANILKSRGAAGRETVALIYRDAGHALSGSGWSPSTQTNLGPMQMGGQPAADARAQAEAFAQTLAFLARTLQ